ncbi:hypothetical protein CRUP_007457 [Coryphaenoides rupestris]|nr:hypothetical protein CRUP_007457 [Coryphaenoides rupestris]
MSVKEQQKQADTYDLSMSEVEVVQPPERGGGRWALAFERFGQPCLAELLGSALFIFAGCLSVIENTPETGRLQPALAHGLALAIVIAVLGAIR